MFIFIALLTPYIEWIEKISSDPMAQIAISHIVFNVVSTIVLFPFAKLLVKLSCLIVPGKDDSESEMHCRFIDDRLLNTPPFAVMQVGKEVARMAILTLTIDPGALPAPQHVLDKHFMRKHGPNAYYGQK